jgi:hypothetical protein
VTASADAFQSRGKIVNRNRRRICSSLSDNLEPVQNLALVQIPCMGSKLGSGVQFESGGNHRGPNLWCRLAGHSKLSEFELIFPDTIRRH